MNREHSPYRLAEELEHALGDPADARTPFSYTACLDLDAREEFPAGICRFLDDWGLPDYYVPVRHGGRLRDYEHALHLVRTVARRDLTVAVAHGKTYLGGVCVWVAGGEEQAARLGSDIRAGVPVSLGLTERAHGSDLLAGEVEAARGRRGIRPARREVAHQQRDPRLGPLRPRPYHLRGRAARIQRAARRQEDADAR
ncbi:acyl-CoA dehydrogenase family protein [Streptomyces sp. GLT-R25]